MSVNKTKSFLFTLDSLKILKFLAIFSLVWLIVSQPYNQKGFKVIEWDVTLYYSYLPATFIHHDLKLEKEWVNKTGNHQFGYKTDENGNRYLKMTAGMAILYSPFFFLAYGLTSFFSPDLATGFTTLYRLALSYGSLIYVLLGLFWLRKVLLRFAKDNAVSWTLTIVFLGTNLLHYTVWRGAMSHGYSFMLACGFLNFMFEYIDKPKLKYAIVLGLISGLLVLIRPVNVLIPLFLGLYLLLKLKGKNEGIQLKDLFVVLLMGVIAVSPQFFIWKYQTDNWIVYSYSEEGFFFNDPQLLKGLFSYRKGWLVYSPLMLLSLIGVGFLFLKDKCLGLVIVALFSTTLYITFSWWCWWYGGSFGARPLIEYYGILAIPLAMLIQYFTEIKRRLVRVGVLTIVSVFIFLSVFQNYQYQRGIIHHDSMTKESYWNVFLKTHHSELYYKSLKSPDYEKAMKGERD